MRGGPCSGGKRSAWHGHYFSGQRLTLHTYVSQAPCCMTNIGQAPSVVSLIRLIFFSLGSDLYPTILVNNKMNNALLMTLSAILMASNFATVLGNDESTPKTIMTSQSQLRRAQSKAGKSEAKAGKSTAKAGKQSSSPTRKPTATAVTLTKSPTRKPTTSKPTTRAPTNSPTTGATVAATVAVTVEPTDAATVAATVAPSDATRF